MKISWFDAFVSGGLYIFAINYFRAGEYAYSFLIVLVAAAYLYHVERE